MYNIWEDCIGSTDYEFWDEIEREEEFREYEADADDQPQYDREREIADSVTARYYRGDVKVVETETCPEIENSIDLWELDTDISQGTGNVIIRYTYDPFEDVVYRYADF